MKNGRIQITFICSLILLLNLAGCSNALSEDVTVACQIPTEDTSAEQAVATETVQPALFGLWVKETDSQRNMLVFTADSVYLVETEENDGAPYTRESFFEVKSIDWVKGELELKLAWVRINGDYGGFDSPLKYMKINIDEASLSYGMGDEGTGMPTETPNGSWIKY